MNLGLGSNLIIRGLDAFVDLFAFTGIRRDFMCFCVVGALGFCWDTMTVYALKDFVGLYIAGTCGFVVAVLIGWAINRFWSFRHLDHAAAHQQLPRYVMANSIGFILNRGTFFTLITVSLLCHNHPVLGIIAGSAAGLVFNYFLSRQFVFRAG